MGTIYWQLNDIWPGASWSSVDYYGRFKALMYYARRFFAPVLISCDEKNEVTERSSVIEEPAPYENSAQLFLSNETRKNVTGTVSWELRRSDSSVIQRGEDKITAAPFSAASLERMKFEDLDILEDHLSYRFIRDNKSEAENETASLGTVLFTAPKHYNFADPKLRLEKNGDIITVTSEAFAKSVEVYSENGYIRTDDNFFDMEKGVRTVRLIEGDASELAVRSVYNIR